MSTITVKPLTAAQRAKVEQEKTDRAARVLARVIMGVMLIASIGANVLTAWDHDWISRIVAGFPPVSLFLTSLLYERMRASLVIKIGMAATIAVSLAFSWVHIAELAYTHHQPLIISVLLPTIIDVPMLFAGSILLSQRSRTRTPAPTKAPEQLSVATTAPAKRTSATPRKKAAPVLAPSHP